MIKGIYDQHKCILFFSVAQGPNTLYNNSKERKFYGLLCYIHCLRKPHSF